MFSNNALHGAPIAFHIIMNTILGTYTNNSEAISIANQPLPPRKTTTQREQMTITTVLMWIFIFPLAPIFLLASFIIFPQVDNISYVKKLIYMCGISSYVYWFSIFIFDLLIYVLELGIIMLLFYTSNLFGSSPEMGAIFTLCLAYGVCSILFSYFFSYMKSVSSALGSFIMFSFLTSIFLTLTVFLMLKSQMDSWIQIGYALKALFSCIPSFLFTFGCVKFTEQAVWNFNWNIMTSEK